MSCRGRLAQAAAGAHLHVQCRPQPRPSVSWGLGSAEIGLKKTTCALQLARCRKGSGNVVGEVKGGTEAGE